MDWITNNALSILNLIILAGLFLYGKRFEKEVNRKKANFEKEIEELKASHSKKQFIHKLQFEKEFKIYEYLWEKIAHFESEFRAFFDKPDEPKDWEKLPDKFKNGLHEIKETMRNNIPFISKDIVVKVKQLIILSLEPSMVYAETKEIDEEKLRKIGKEETKISGEIEKAIRERIDNMGGANLIE